MTLTDLVRLHDCTLRTPGPEVPIAKTTLLALLEEAALQRGVVLGRPPATQLPADTPQAAPLEVWGPEPV